MKWKKFSECTPTFNVMFKSKHDLIIFDGSNYHRGFATYKWSENINLYRAEFYSIDTKNVINCERYLEIKPAKRGLKMNIW